MKESDFTALQSRGIIVRGRRSLTICGLDSQICRVRFPWKRAGIAAKSPRVRVQRIGTECLETQTLTKGPSFLGFFAYFRLFSAIFAYFGRGEGVVEAFSFKSSASRQRLASGFGFRISDLAFPVALPSGYPPLPMVS